MEREGRRQQEDGVLSYLWIPFKFIHQTLRSLLVKLFGLRSPSPAHSFQEVVEEVVEVVEVSSRGIFPARSNKKLEQKPRESSGKPGGIHKNK